MLTTYPAAAREEPLHATRKVLWIDLLDPTDEEKASVETKFGLELPSRRELSEVESSSRISEKDGVLFLSMPIVANARAPDEEPSPIGFVLSKDVLATIRYTQLRSFETVATKFAKNEPPGSGVEAFAALVDEMVDLSADMLEGIAAELDAVSRSVFLKTGGRRRLTRSNDGLHDTLVEVGNAGERLSRIRDSLLGLQRIVPFASDPDRDWIANNVRTRLRSAQKDLLSLTDVLNPLIQQGSISAGCCAGLHQYQAKRYLHGFDDRFGCWYSADPRGQHLWNEFQKHAGTRLGMGLSVRLGVDCT